MGYGKKKTGQGSWVRGRQRLEDRGQKTEDREESALDSADNSQWKAGSESDLEVRCARRLS